MQTNTQVKSYSLEGQALVSPQKVLKEKIIKCNSKKIESIGKEAKYHVKLADSFIFPALINLHDHLRGDYLPRVGPKPGTFYLNWAPWDKDLKSSEVYKERADLTVDECYELGAYKNLFSGVCTVNDHFPHEINGHVIPGLPIRVIQNYTLAHECSSYDLQWGDGIEIEHERAIKKNYPFITHLEEGFDEESQRGIDILENLKCLDEYGVLIHCVGFSESDIKKAKKAKVTIGWCPASNIFMYNFTCKIRKMIDTGLNIAIGTDSTHTGSVNLLEEMRFARKIYRKMYGEDLDPKIITQMATINAARGFRMEKEIGTLETGKLADILAIKQKHDDPYESLLAANIHDIDLLVLEGNPIFGGIEYKELFKHRGITAQEVSIKKRNMLVTGNPVGLLNRVREVVGRKKVLDYMPLDVEYKG
ncbi:MAG: amidohydrolase family protein [Spirochaetales bacterium]|nr:amidohydrolase family protein [Spirochaetales bacterium]